MQKNEINMAKAFILKFPIPLINRDMKIKTILSTFKKYVLAICISSSKEH